jgi:hypothetical protein
MSGSQEVSAWLAQQTGRLSTRPRTGTSHSSAPPASVCTQEIFVVTTSVAGTVAAGEVAAALARALDAPITLIDFRFRSHGLGVQGQAECFRDEIAQLLERLKDAQLDVRVRVYVCRETQSAVDVAFRPHSLIVIGARPSRWPTRFERLRRRLERHGHFVVFVSATDESDLARDDQRRP